MTVTILSSVDETPGTPYGEGNKSKLRSQPNMLKKLSVLLITVATVFSFAFLKGSAESGFTITLNPASGSVIQGSSVQTTVTVTGQEEQPSGNGLLSVSLAQDTPTFSLVVPNAQFVPFTKVLLAASGGDVVVDRLVIQRKGLSLDMNFRGIVLVDPTTHFPIVDPVILDQNHRAVFEDDILVKQGETKALFLAVNMAPTVNASELPSLALVDVMLKGDATFNGSLPVEGNELLTNASITIGTMTVASGALNPPVSTHPIGTNDYIFTSVRMIANSVEDQYIERVRFFNSGTAVDGDIENFELVLDGNVISSVSEMTNNEVIFDLSQNPVLLNKGTNKEFSLRGDIVAGANRTVSLGFQKVSDVISRGADYDFYMLIVYPNTTNPYLKGNTLTIAPNEFGINQPTTSLGNQNISLFGATPVYAQSSVQLSVNELPTGATATFSPSNSCNPDCSVTMAIQTFSSTPTGVYSVVVEGTRDGIQRQAVYTLTVKEKTGIIIRLPRLPRFPGQ